ncbi:MAG TPA: ATP-binding protein [Desulfomonilaceae bacterium]|nr:ATP-binding protein [Desulfomonilaceae bacterium]
MPTAAISIRHKVIIAVAALYLFMTAGLLGSYYFMHQLEDKIGYLEDVSKLEESVLEIRRFEKNYFLYADDHSLRSALYQLPRIQALVEKNSGRIEALSSPEQVDAFRKNLQDYEHLMSRCADPAMKDRCPSTTESRLEYESDIRKIGSSMAEFGREVAQKKRASIKQTMGATVRLQLLAFVFVGIGLIVVGSFMFAKIMKPLRLLERSTESIAKGQFKPIENLPPERELRDIFDSFNRMAAQLKIREEQLVESKKLASLGTMLAGVAHEVNNPLSNISSSCEIMMEELDEADREWQRAVLKKVLEQVDKARGIVINLLEFSRNKEFFRERFNLREILEKTLGLLHGQIPPGVRMNVRIDGSLTIFGDKQRLQQAFMNLISNAVQAIEDEGDVEIRANGLRQGMVSVLVRDTGKGIKDEDLPRIFDPFFTTKDVGQGTGLGLFITHDIIVGHNGTIQVKSVLGKGTTFTVKIPAAEPIE